MILLAVAANVLDVDCRISPNEVAIVVAALRLQVAMRTFSRFLLRCFLVLIGRCTILFLSIARSLLFPWLRLFIHVIVVTLLAKRHDLIVKHLIREQCSSIHGLTVRIGTCTEASCIEVLRATQLVKV